MRIEAIITDLDGTTIDSPIQKTVSERTTAAVRLAHDAGIKVCAATGRPLSFAAPVFESMGLRDPAIIAGGSQIVDPVSHKKLWGLNIEPADLEQIVRMVRPLGVRALWNDYIEPEYNEQEGRDINTLQSMSGIHFFELVYIPHEDAKSLREQLDKVEGITAVLVTADRDGFNDIHIVNKKATKEHAIYELERLIGVTKGTSVGIGDGPNDRHLFNAVGYKVAMGNAVQNLKDIADEVIGTVQEDGWAKYVEGLVKETR